jgi:pimeloyl-ACP methyl ester carboxylesterase
VPHLYTKYRIQTAPDKLASTRQVGPSALQPTPAAAAAAAASPPPPPEPPLVVPNAKLADWSPEQSLWPAADETNPKHSLLTAYLLMMLARISYGNDPRTLESLSSWLGFTDRTTTTVPGPYTVVYDTYTFPNKKIILAFRGTPDFSTFANFASPGFGPIDGLPDTWWFFRGLSSYLRAAEAYIVPVLATKFAESPDAITLCGHSLGGILASWVAFRLNVFPPPDTDNLRPAGLCYSFGAPSAYWDIYGKELFRNGELNVRCFVGNDPVPDTVQLWASILGFWQFQPGLGPVPNHHCSVAVPLTSGVRYEQVFHFPFDYPTNLFPPFRQANYLAAAHSADNYIASIDALLRREGITPVPWYNRLYRAAVAPFTPGTNE